MRKGILPRRMGLPTGRLLHHDLPPDVLLAHLPNPAHPDSSLRRDGSRCSVLRARYHYLYQSMHTCSRCVGILARRREICVSQSERPWVGIGNHQDHPRCCDHLGAHQTTGETGHVGEEESAGDAYVRGRTIVSVPLVRVC